MATEWQYMPILKWKRGERDALRGLESAQWEGVVPLAELNPIGAAPDTASLRIALPAYVNDVADQIKKSVPEGLPVAIDTVYVSTGYPKQLNLLLAIYRRLQKLVPDHQVIPVVTANELNAIAALKETDSSALKGLDDVILRLRTDQFESAQVVPFIDALAKSVKRKNIHLLLDQFSIVDKKHQDCYLGLSPYLVAAASATCASVTVAGGSFPVNLTGKKQGYTDLPRVEWNIWRQIVASGEYLKFRYADYTVSNPNPMDEDVDPKKVNPSIAIRYASDNFWRLYKGAGFKGAPSGVLRSLCKLLLTDPIYGGKPYSFGDQKYSDYSTGSEKNGIPWTWRRDATNRHIVHTSNQL
jgi:Beta protein